MDTKSTSALVTDIRFEHHRPQFTLGQDNPRPRISWRISTCQDTSFSQSEYEIEVYLLLPTTRSFSDKAATESRVLLVATRSKSSKTQLVPWPCEADLNPRDRVSVRVRARSPTQEITPWSDEAVYERGLSTRDEWHCSRITSAQLIQSTILNQEEDAQAFAQESTTCRRQFSSEYICPSGRMSSDSQTAYTLAIVFDILPSDEQVSFAGRRLATIVRRNNFKIGTGFAGTPYLCEALMRTGHSSVAYATLLCEECPSWLYPLTVGATTMWERWDSMLPGGKVNPGEMTSFNHYCFGSVVSFLHERLGGLQRIEPGWKRFRFAPQPGGGITSAHVKQLTPYGWVSGQWKVEDGSLKAELDVPNMTEAEVVLPFAAGDITVVLGGGHWSFVGEYRDRMVWPVEAIAAFPNLEPPDRQK